MAVIDGKLANLIHHLPIPYAHLQLLQDTKGNAIDARILSANRTYRELFGMEKSDVEGQTLTDLFPDLMIAQADWIDVYRKVVDTGESVRFQQYFEPMDRWFDITVYRDEPGCFSTVFFDITANKKKSGGLDLVLAASRDFLQIPFAELDPQLLTDNVLELSGARYVTLNVYNKEKTRATTLALSGQSKKIAQAEEILDISFVNKEWPVDSQRLFRIKEETIVAYSDLHKASYGILSKPLAAVLEKLFWIGKVYVMAIVYGDDIMGDFVFCMPQGKELQHSDLVLFLSSQVGLVLARKEAEEKIQYISFHDTLTGLFNRRYLEEEMKRLDTWRQLPISLIMVDVNGLKLINDAYGHDKGDELLKKAADVLRQSCRNEDIMGRWGGDEFVLVLPQTTVRDGERIGQRILEEADKAKIEHLPVSLSLGLATKEVDKFPLTDVLKEAEDRMYRHKLSESRKARHAVLTSLLQTLAEKTDETEEHLWRMQGLAFRLADRINLSDGELDRLSLLIHLHDIGKITISRELFFKTGTLKEEEWEQLKRHAETGYRIARSTEDFAHVAGDILAHHERWDGKGYPQGLKGKEIPILARIIAVVDAYDVMTHGRVYRDAVTSEEAREEIRCCSGKQFDPQLVQFFLELWERGDMEG